MAVMFSLSICKYAETHSGSTLTFLPVNPVKDNFATFWACNAVWRNQK